MLLRLVERSRLPGRTECDDPGDSGIEILGAEPLDRADIDGTVYGERRDERYPNAAEIEITGHDDERSGFGL
jgi:hypothetical protein